MGRSTVRISERSHDLLRNLAQREGTPMQAVLEKALESYRRQRFLDQVNDAYAALHREPQQAASLGAELREWEAALADGLPRDKPQTTRAPLRAGTKRGRKS